MGLHYQNLDSETRTLMLEELEMDVENGSVYMSGYLNETGYRRWISAMQEAIRTGNDNSLAESISVGNFLKQRHERRTKRGVTMVKVPYTAPNTLAEGEFNRYYVRALCRRSIADGSAELEVYRAKQVINPRTRSERLVGTHIDAHTTLNDIRKSVGVDTGLGMPPGPNSGLSVKLP